MWGKGGGWVWGGGGIIFGGGGCVIEGNECFEGGGGYIWLKCWIYGFCDWEIGCTGGGINGFEICCGGGFWVCDDVVIVVLFGEIWWFRDFVF